MKMNSTDISDLLAEIIIMTMIGTVVSFVFYGLMWAQQEELELGIHGRSSESLLIEREQKIKE